MKKVLSLLMSLAMIISSFAGMTGIFPQTVMAAEAVTLTVSNNEVNIYDASFDQYFSGTAAEGVEALLSAGKVTLNNMVIPAEAPDSDLALMFNGSKALWKLDNGNWTWQSHDQMWKDTTGEGDTFENARTHFMEGITQFRGMTTELIAEDGGDVATAIKISVESGGQVEQIIDNGDHYTIFGTPVDAQSYYTDGGPNDVEGRDIPKENFDPEIKVDDTVLYWYGADEEGNYEWFMKKAKTVTGLIKAGSSSSALTLIDSEGNETTYADALILRYSMQAGSRPHQVIDTTAALGLNDIPVTLYNTDTGYVVGISRVETAAEALTRAIAYAEENTPEYVISADGSDVPASQKWVTQSVADAFTTALANAKTVDADDSASNSQKDAATYALGNAFGGRRGLLNSLKDGTKEEEVPAGITGVSTIGFIDYDGAKVSTVVAEYNVDLDGAELSTSDFEVESNATWNASNVNIGENAGAVKNVYVNDEPEATDTPSGTGRYVIVELNTDYKMLSGNANYKSMMSAGLIQKNDITVGDVTISATEESVKNYDEVETVGRNGRITITRTAREGSYTLTGAERFENGVYTGVHCWDEATGEYSDVTITYALAVPESYETNPNGTYGLAIFIGSLGETSTDPLELLTGCRAGVDMASDEVQAYAKAAGMDGVFVLALQSNGRPSADNFTNNGSQQAHWKLMDEIIEQYGIDQNHIYATGQSMGGMEILSMSAQRDNFFAGVWAVASQWGNDWNKADAMYNGAYYYPFPADDEVVWSHDADGNPVDYTNYFYMISDDNILVTCGTGDALSYAGWNETKYLYRDLVDVQFPELIINPKTASIAEQDAIMQQLLAMESGNGFHWLKLEGAEHTPTFCYAYQIHTGYEWLFSQTRATAMAREKLDLNKPFEFADVQLLEEDRILGTINATGETVYAVTGKAGTGTIGYNSAWANMGTLINHPGWTVDKSEIKTIVINMGDDKTVDDTMYDSWYEEGNAADGIKALIAEGKVCINNFVIPATAEAFEADGFTVNGDSWIIPEDGGTYKVDRTGGLAYEDAALAALKRVSNGNEILLEDEDGDGFIDNINALYVEALIADVVTDNGDGTITVQRGEPDESLVFEGKDGRVFDDSNAEVTGAPVGDIKPGDMVFIKEIPDGWVVEKAREVNGILVDGEDHGYYQIDDVQYGDAMRFSRDNIIISNRCGELVNAHKYFGFINNDEGLKVSLWFVNTTDETKWGAPAGFTTAGNAATFLAKAIEAAEAKLEAVVPSKDGSDVLVGKLWATQEDIDDLQASIDRAKTVLNDKPSEALMDYQVYLLYFALNGSSQDIGARFAGFNYVGFDNQVAEGTREAGTPVVVNNDGVTKVTDAVYDQYFGDKTAAEGVAELLAAGKCYINGIKIPATETETVEYQINWVKSLWKTDAGWCYNVHKYTGADNMTFEAARKDLFDMTSTVRGHQTTFYVDENDICTAINIESYEVVRVAEIEDMGHDTVLHRGDFELETQRVRYDINLIHFPSENVAEDIQVSDIAVYWYGPEELGGLAQWHAVRATPYVGKITKDPNAKDSTYIVNEGTESEYRSVESNVSRYNLIDCSRPTQGYSVYTRLELTDEEIVLWNTPNGYPIGFTFGIDKEASRANLGKAIENAKALEASVKVSSDGSGVRLYEKWATQEAHDSFNAAIAKAEAVYKANASSHIDIDWAMWELRTAWGEGGNNPSGFVGEIGVNEGDPNEYVWYNDGSTKITDPAFDSYFGDMSAAEGVAALLAAGKCSINGKPIPANETDTNEYQINYTKSLWKTDAGWCYNVHKYTGADNMSFVDARKELFDMTSTVRGHFTTLKLDDDGICTAIDIESFEVVKVVYFENHGGSVDKLDRGDFELETQRIRYDFNKITAIPSVNWDSNIDIGDVVVYWDGANGWNAVKAGQHIGVLTKDSATSEYIVNEGQSDEWRMIESNVSRYNLIDDTRPTQAYTAYVRLGLQEAGIPIITWVTPNDFPIGFSYGERAKEALTLALNNAQELVDGVRASEDGYDVPSNRQWATQAAIDAFKVAIAEARAINNSNSSANYTREKAIYALALAWGEGGSKPSGFVGEIGYGYGEPEEDEELISIKVIPARFVLEIGDEFQAQVLTNPRNYKGLVLDWTSSDPSIAAVDDEGIITAIAVGKVTVTAATLDGKISAKCEVTVEGPAIDIAGASVSITSGATLTKGTYWTYYDGTDQTPAVEVTMDGQTLIQDTDYTVAYSDNQSVGTATITINGIGSYNGSTTITFLICFKDVAFTHNFQKAVYWAVDEGIAAGYTGAKLGQFGVNDDITRGQVAMFLWRAAGQPAPAGNTQTFTDVPTSSNFYKAIQWAYEQGITGGYTGSREGQFGPSDNCTRGQIVMFLWRFAGKPAPEGNTQTFTDVPTSSNFYKAVQWAYEQGITAGYSDGSFGVSRNCTRGHCVTFLYRLLGE